MIKYFIVKINQKTVLKEKFIVTLRARKVISDINAKLVICMENILKMVKDIVLRHNIIVENVETLKPTF